MKMLKWMGAAALVVALTACTKTYKMDEVTYNFSKGVVLKDGGAPVTGIVEVGDDLKVEVKDGKVISATDKNGNTVQNPFKFF